MARGKRKAAVGFTRILILIVSAAAAIVLGAIGLRWASAANASPRASLGLLDLAGEKARAAQIVGPTDSLKNCSACHMLEAQAWQRTHHFTTFFRRHRTARAQEILHNMGQLTMKRQGECRQCHYTSTLEDDHVMPMWGVSCESCHGPAKSWVEVHNKLAGDPKGAMIKWGVRDQETPGQRDARLSAAEARGMISSRMIYDLAARCMQCHTVPDEQLVNRGGHHAGSDFGLVAWFNGEVRHNFVDSPGAPVHPTNRPLSDNERRRLYVVGALVDLQFSLRNLAGAQEKGGEFEQAMVQRVATAREKLAAIVAAVPIPEVESVFKLIPVKISSPAEVPADLPEEIAELGRRFAARCDGSTLTPLDPQIPTSAKGSAFAP